MGDRAPDVSVLVVSCDGYSDLWAPFFTLYFRYWPDCPYPVYLGTNEMTYEHSRVTTIRTGPDRDWAAALRSMLVALPSRRVIVLLEDYLLTAPVDTARIRELVGVAKVRDAACLRLVPVPGAEGELGDTPGVGELAPGVDYRVSLQAAIWDRDVLAALVQVGESPWRLEIDGSGRSAAIDQPFLSVVAGASWPVRYFVTGVVRGRWLREAVDLLRREGIDPDLSARPIEGRWQALRRTRTPAAVSAALAVMSRVKRSFADAEPEPAGSRPTLP